jgi:hypothetical protein
MPVFVAVLYLTSGERGGCARLGGPQDGAGFEFWIWARLRHVVNLSGVRRNTRLDFGLSATSMFDAKRLAPQVIHCCKAGIQRSTECFRPPLP